MTKGQAVTKVETRGACRRLARPGGGRRRWKCVTERIAEGGVELCGGEDQEHDEGEGKGIWRSETEAAADGTRLFPTKLP